jgi:uncharacterized membrane protein
MDKGNIKIGFLDRFLWIIVYILGISVILSVLTGVLSGATAASTVGFLFSAFALQAIAAPVGLKIGLSPLQTLVFMAFFGIGLIMGVFEICQTLGTSSKRVGSFIDKIKQKTSKYPFLSKYGSISCFLLVWIPGIGLYGTPVIAWLLSWKRLPATIFTFIGFMSGCFTFLFLAGVIFV